MGSQATRDADSVLFTRAGLEIGVAATKTFIGQVAAMYLLGLWLAEAAGTLSAAADRRADRRAEGAAAQDRGDDRGGDQQVRAIARSHYEGRFFLYLGRHIGLPICLEGALKMKEISYIPSDAYAAGEMKHGPIALLDETTPVVCVATDSPVLDKVLSNIAEVRARGADVIAIGTEGSDRVAEAADQTICSPAHRLDPAADPRRSPLQLLAYDTARQLGLNVDQPRNLAKTVTVESNAKAGRAAGLGLSADGGLAEAAVRCRGDAGGRPLGDRGAGGALGGADGDRGTAVAEAVAGLSPEGPVRVVCGKGNNAGDGLVAARYLARPATRSRRSCCGRRGAHAEASMLGWKARARPSTRFSAPGSRARHGSPPPRRSTPSTAAAPRRRLRHRVRGRRLQRGGGGGRG